MAAHNSLIKMQPRLHSDKNSTSYKETMTATTNSLDLAVFSMKVTYGFMCIHHINPKISSFTFKTCIIIDFATDDNNLVIIIIMIVKN